MGKFLMVRRLVQVGCGVVAAGLALVLGGVVVLIFIDFSGICSPNGSALASVDRVATKRSTAWKPGAVSATRKRADDSIPTDYERLYQKAGAEYGIDWTVLAAIGKAESDHGRSTLPGVRSGTNYYGAGGPMQFIVPTWKAYGVDGENLEGERDGVKDLYDPVDAIPGAANYLKASGAPQKMRQALSTYGGDPSGNYADKVLGLARVYARGDYTAVGVNPGGASCAPGSTQGRWPPGSPCPPGNHWGPENITPRMACVRDQIKELFDFTGKIGCYRIKEDGGEHPRGRACDFMVSPYGTMPSPAQRELGDNIAAWAQENADKLGIYYIIFRQHIWNPARASEGWRLQENRGDNTQNHFDHVHISVLP
jgi:hypothetical protein